MQQPNSNLNTRILQTQIHVPESQFRSNEAEEREEVGRLEQNEQEE